MTTGSIAVRSVESLADMEAVAEGWRALELRCPTPLSYFQTYDWCRAWVTAFAGPQSGVGVFVQTAWRNGEMVAVWPLMIFARSRLRRVVTLGDPYTQYSNVIYDPKQISDTELEAFISRCLGSADVDVAVFDAVPARSALARQLGLHPGSVIGQDNESLILDLTAWPSSDVYRGQQARDQRRNRERKRRHLARHGDLSFEVIWPDHPDFKPLVRRAIDMKREWLRATGRLSIGMMAGAEDFFAGLSGSPESMAGAILSVMRAGDRVVALELGFLRDRHYYGHVGAFDWELAALSPGKVQIEMTICWLIDHGVTCYDFLANATDYKRSWSNRSEPLKSFAVPFSWKGRLYAEAWIPNLKPAIKRAYYAMPGGVRRLIARAQNAAGLSGRT